jgi:hypothetical protein
MGLLIAGMRRGAGVFGDLGHYNLTGLKVTLDERIKLYVAKNLPDA